MKTSRGFSTPGVLILIVKLGNPRERARECRHLACLIRLQENFFAPDAEHGEKKVIFCLRTLLPCNRAHACGILFVQQLQQHSSIALFYCRARATLTNLESFHTRRSTDGRPLHGRCEWIPPHFLARLQTPPSCVDLCVLVCIFGHRTFAHVIAYALCRDAH